MTQYAVSEFFERHKNDRLEANDFVDMHHAAHAVEDLPLHARAEGKRVLGREFGARTQQREFDALKHTELNELKSDAAHAGGELELVFKFLARYPVTDYQYDVAPGFLTRGDRPNVAKLKDLADDNFTATLSLCKETPEGDRPLIEEAGLGDKLAPLHVGIVDGTAPSTSQVVEILDLLENLRIPEPSANRACTCTARPGRAALA
jgi:hypothetical protein